MSKIPPQLDQTSCEVRDFGLNLVYALSIHSREFISITPSTIDCVQLKKHPTDSVRHKAFDYKAFSVSYEVERMALAHLLQGNFQAASSC